MKAVILGLGESLHLHKKQKSDFVIGCNNIYDHVKEIDAIACVDKYSRVSIERPSIFDTPDHVYKYVRDKEWVGKMPNVRVIESVKSPTVLYKNTPISHGYTCPYYATVLAMYLQFDEIEVFGVDHSGTHPLANDYSRKRSALEFAKLIKFAENENIKISFNKACMLEPLVDQLLNTI